jgi:hypothetical protein
MLILRNHTWFAFIEEPDNNYERNVTVYEISINYKGLTDKGFEFEVKRDGYANVRPSKNLLKSNQYRDMGGVISIFPVYHTIYLSQNEVEEMYKDPCGFYRKYIKDSETCYVQTIMNGGAGSEHI